MVDAAHANAEVAPATAAYLRLYDKLRSLLTRRLGSPADAEDIVQDAYLRLARRGDAVVEVPDALVYRIAGNLALDHQRKLKHRAGPSEAPDTADEAPDVEQRLLDRERLQFVLQVVQGMPTRRREVFVLRKLENLDQQTVTERLGVSRNMVEKHLRLAFEDIAAALAERG